MTEISALSVANCHVHLPVSTAVGSLSSLNGNLGQHDPDHVLINAITGAYSTTKTAQTFYLAEFVRAVGALTDVGTLQGSGAGENAEQIFSRITGLQEELQQNGEKGLHFRLWRDGISLVSSVMLLGAVASAWLSPENQNDADFSAANHPLGNLAADLGLVALEGSKMLLTTSLSYPTLKRHHLTDEFVKRMTVCVELLQACLDDHHAGEPAHSRLSSSLIKRRALQCMEKGRDISTVFTLLNTTLSTVRAALLTLETLGSDAGPASWRGLLRMVQNASDCTRAIFSTVGTFARNKLFADDLTYCQSAIPAMRHQLRDANAANVLPKLKKMELLISMCSTPLLIQMAKSDQLTKAYLDAPIHSAQAVQDFLQQSEIGFTVASDGLFLHDKPPENPWGQRFTNGAYACSATQVARLFYRLALEGQNQLSRPIEWLSRR